MVRNSLQRIVPQILSTDLDSAAQDTSINIHLIPNGHFDLLGFPCQRNKVGIDNIYQKMHGKIREHSLEVGRKVKEEGLSASDVCVAMLGAIDGDPEIPLDVAEVNAMLNAWNLIGRCSGQVTDYLEQIVGPLLAKESGAITVDTEVNV